MKQWAKEREHWLLVVQDECWFSRFAQPNLHSFAQAGDNLKLVEPSPTPKDKNKAIACFGAVCQESGECYFYLADGQPNTERTISMLKALLAVAQSKSKRVLVVLWDRATWHQSKRLKQWLCEHNLLAKKADDGVRLLTYLLPIKSPWLNPMEPIWLHAKRKVAEFDGSLSVAVLKARLCAYFQTSIDSASLKPSA